MKNNPKVDAHISIKEVLDVFDVLSYEDNKFVSLNADRILAMFYGSSSNKSVQRAFMDIPFEVDAKISQALSDIALAMRTDDNEDKDITSNKIGNGKNYIGANNRIGKEDDRQEEDIVEKVREALAKIPTLVAISSGNTVDEFMDRMNRDYCQPITGIPFTWMAKTLGRLNMSEKRRLEMEIGRIRLMEKREIGQ